MIEDNQSCWTDNKLELKHKAKSMELGYISLFMSSVQCTLIGGLLILAVMLLE